MPVAKFLGGSGQKMFKGVGNTASWGGGIGLHYMDHKLKGDMWLGFRAKLDFFPKALTNLFKITSTGEAKSKLRTATPKTSSLQGMS